MTQARDTSWGKTRGAFFLDLEMLALADVPAGYIVESLKRKGLDVELINNAIVPPEGMVLTITREARTVVVRWRQRA
jgi:hypothetical protein